MSISFNEIPGPSLMLPGFYAEFSNERAITGLVVGKRRVLVIGQKLATGVANAGVPVPVTRPTNAVALFGRGSMLAAMCAAFLKAGGMVEMWALPLTDLAEGVAATHTITVATAPTGPGTLYLYIGGTRIPVGIAGSETANQTATKIATAIGDYPDLPVTAAANNAVVTLTFRHKGECGNALDIRTRYQADEVLPASLALTFAAGTAGSGNPDIPAALAGLGDAQYHDFVMPYTDTTNLTALEVEALDRWNANRMIEGYIWAGFRGNFSATDAFGDARNSFLASTIGTSTSPVPPWIWASIVGAVAATALQDDPARPLQTLILPGVLAPTEPERFDRTERNLLLQSGISTYTVDADGTVRIERMVTMYKTNAFGLPDTSYLDAETIATLGYLRLSMRVWLAQKFPRYKLTDDSTNIAPGQAMVQPRTIRTELIAWARSCEELGLVENIDQFKSELVVVRNSQVKNRIDAKIPPDIVNQFRQFAGKIEFIL